MTVGRGFLLVHGGSHGAWCWDRLIPSLTLPATAVQLPGRHPGPVPLGELTVSDYVAAIVDSARSSGCDEIVLVGHSLAGLSIPVAAEQLGPRVRHLVFVSAVVAQDGACAVDLVPRLIRSLVVTRLARSAARGVGFSLPTPISRWAFCHDLDAATAAEVMGRLCPEPPRVVIDPVPRPALRADLPRTYIGFEQDRLVPERWQRRHAAAIDATWVGCPGGHDGLISQPTALASRLNAIAAAS